MPLPGGSGRAEAEAPPGWGSWWVLGPNTLEAGLALQAPRSARGGGSSRRRGAVTSAWPAAPTPRAGRLWRIPVRGALLTPASSWRPSRALGKRPSDESHLAGSRATGAGLRSPRTDCPGGRAPLCLGLSADARRPEPGYPRLSSRTRAPRTAHLGAGCLCVPAAGRPESWDFGRQRVLRPRVSGSAPGSEATHRGTEASKLCPRWGESKRKLGTRAPALPARVSALVSRVFVAGGWS